MVKHDLTLRDRHRQLRKLLHLIKIQPGIKGVASVAKRGHSSPEVGVGEQVRPGLVMTILDVGVGAPICAMAHASKQARTTSIVFRENFANPLTHGQVDMSDDASDLGPSQPK